MNLFNKLGKLYKKIREAIVVVLFLLVFGVLAVLGWQWGRQGIAQQIYRERLETLHQQYAVLQEQYAALVRKTAITELLVDDEGVAIVVRSDAGELSRLATNLNPELEVYVDYIVLDGRLWIRRVFDSSMSPGEGILVDPRLVGIPWQDYPENESFGKAVYRRLTPGRWVVTTTGNGALGLAKVDADEEIRIQSPHFALIEEDWERSVQVSIDEVGWKDAARWILSRSPW